jgi:hypothetical protein
MPRPLPFVIGSLAAAALVALPAASAGAATRPATLTEAQAQKVGTDAYVYGIDLLEFVHQTELDTSVTVPNQYGNAPVNEVGNQRVLTTPANQDKEIVGPSNSTLYSNAHLNLNEGPIVLHVPALPKHRYYAWEFLDPYLNVFHYVGTRSTGNGAGNYVVVGPGFRGKLPAGLPVVHAKYDHVWLFGRTLVYGKSDLPEAHKIQDGYKVIPLKAFERAGDAYTPSRPRRIITTPKIPSMPSGLAFYDALGTALAENPPPARDHAILAEMATAGIGPDLHPSTSNLPGSTTSGLTAAANAGPAKILSIRLSIATNGAHKHNGWFQLLPDTGNWGTDYAYRAMIAVYAICANLPIEATYAAGVADNTNNVLEGGNSYRIHFPAGDIPPVKYFWSLTVYNTSTELIPNAYNKYSVGSNKGIKFNQDGSLDIYVQQTPPAGHEANWLVSPSSGQFLLALRFYGPARSVLNGSYKYPTIERVG